MLAMPAAYMCLLLQGLVPTAPEGQSVHPNSPGPGSPRSQEPWDVAWWTVHYVGVGSKDTTSFA